MFDWLAWFTNATNAKIFSLLLFFGTFVVIVIYVFTGKKRAKRLESYKNIPFQEPDEPDSYAQKVTDDGRKND